MSSINSNETCTGVDVVAEFYGFTYTQTKGQRIFARNHNLLQEPNLSCEIFIGRIPGNCYEDTLIPIFSQAGTVFEFRLLFKTNDVTRGYGFAKYYTIQDANNAIQMFDGYEIRPNWKLGVMHSENNCRLSVDNFPWGTIQMKQHLVSSIYKCAKQVKQIRFKETPAGTSAIIEFETHLEAALAKKQLKQFTFLDSAHLKKYTPNVDFLSPYTPSWRVQQFNQVATYDKITDQVVWQPSAQDTATVHPVHQVNGSRRPILGKSSDVLLHQRMQSEARTVASAASRVPFRFDEQPAFGMAQGSTLSLLQYMISQGNSGYNGF